VTTQLGSPTGLAIDYWMTDRIFWSDSKENTIESINFGGSDRVLVSRSGTHNPYSLDVFGTELYWVSPNLGEVAMMDKFGRGVNKTIQAGLEMPKAIKFAQNMKLDTNSESGH
jgi:low density lipoprotein-related protein 2